MRKEGQQKRPPQRLQGGLDPGLVSRSHLSHRKKVAVRNDSVGVAEAAQCICWRQHFNVSKPGPLREQTPKAVTADVKRQASLFLASEVASGSCKLSQTEPCMLSQATGATASVQSSHEACERETGFLCGTQGLGRGSSSPPAGTPPSCWVVSERGPHIHALKVTSGRRTGRPERVLDQAPILFGYESFRY